MRQLCTKQICAMMQGYTAVVSDGVVHESSVLAIMFIYRVDRAPLGCVVEACCLRTRKSISGGVYSRVDDGEYPMRRGELCASTLR